MDFHSLTRRQLQSLCKLNKIPANITNVAMADALNSLEIVQGIEEFLNVSQSETADLVESMEQLEVSSPKAPNTRCRTSTHQKVKNTDAENLPPTATRTTRRGSKLLAKGVEESKNDTLKTPAISSSRRKAMATSSCQKLNTQLYENEEEGLVDQKIDCIPNTPAAVVMSSRRKATTVQKTYSTRRSTRLTEKKSAESRVEKEIDNSVNISSLLVEENVASKELHDDVNVASEDVSIKLVEPHEKTVGSDLPKSEVEDKCNTFEKTAVLIEEDLNVEAAQKCGEEKEVYGGLDNLNPTLDETSNQNDEGGLEEKPKVEEKLDLVEARAYDVSNQKPNSDSITNPVEDEVLEERLDLGEEFIASEVNDQNPSEMENLEEEEKLEEQLDLVEKDSLELKMDEVCDQKLNSYSISSPSEDEDLGEKPDFSELDDQNTNEDKDLKEMLELVEKFSSEVKTDKAFDHEPELDGISSASEDEDLEEKHDLEEQKLGANEANDQNSNGDEDLEEKLDLVEKVSLGVKTDEVFDHEPESDIILSPCEDKDFGEKFDASEVNDQNLDMVSGEQSDIVVDSNPEEIFDQNAESDSISSPFEDGDQNLSDSVVDDDDNSEVTDEIFDQNPKSDCISSSSEDEVKDQNRVLAPEEHSTTVVDNNPGLESVDEAFDVIPIADNLSTVTEELQDVNPDDHVMPMNKSLSKTPAPFKTMTIISDDKENIESGRKLPVVFLDEGKKIKNENNEKEKVKSLNDTSIRQLRIQLKALTLKHINTKQDADSKEVISRSALQVLHENRLVGDETKN